MIFSKPMILSVVSSAFGSTVFAFAEEFQKRQLDLIEKANALGSDSNAEEIEFVRREVAKRAERGLFWTALFAAARDSKTTAVALLLQARADIHEGIYGEKKTPRLCIREGVQSVRPFSLRQEPIPADSMNTAGLPCTWWQNMVGQRRQSISSRRKLM